MSFKGNFYTMGYLGETICYFLFSYTSMYREEVWSYRTCKEEFALQAKRYENSQFLFYGNKDLKEVAAKFNEYAERIDLAARAEMGVIKDMGGKTFPVIVVNNTGNPLEREAAAILIKTLYLNKLGLLFRGVDIPFLLECGPYFTNTSSLCNVFSNWKEFISGVTEKQLGELYYEFYGTRGHGGLICWLKHIFGK